MTLTERAQRVLADCKSFDVCLPIAVRFLIRDLLAENAKLRALNATLVAAFPENADD